MKCVDIENYLSDHIADELDSFNARKVELHLKDCHSCQREADVLKETNQLLRNLPPIISPNKLDERMMQSFRKHQQEKQESNFWTAFFANFSISKPALAFSLIALIAFAGAGFQLGRMTSPNVEFSEKQSNESSKQNQIVKIVEKRVEVPVIKTVEVPVYREKIINRVIYRNRKSFPKTEFAAANNLSNTYSQNNSATFIQTSNESFTPINLKNFQQISEIKVSIIKKGEGNEK